MEKINYTEYKKLKNQKNKKAIDSWILRENLQVHPLINKVFKKSNVLSELCFYSDYGNNKLTSQFRVPEGILDHYYGVELNREILDEMFIFGIMTFPYQDFNSNEELLEYVNKKDDFWNIYLINPLLMDYSSAMGFFLMPALTYEGGRYGSYLDNVNGLFEKETGYSLFYQITEDTVDEIIEEVPDLSDNAFKKIIIKHPSSFEILNGESFENLTELENKQMKFNRILFTREDRKGVKKVSDIMFDKMFNFWFENKEFMTFETISSLYESFKNNTYGGKMFNTSSDLQKLKSEKPFKITNTRTGKLLGIFYTFHMDMSFNVCDVTFASNNTVVAKKLTDIDILDWKLGNYELELVKEE